jgi:hypothetical protein
MITITLKMHNTRKNYVLESIEEASGVPRELWETVRTLDENEVMLRQIYAYMLMELVKMPLKTVFFLLNYKTHSTILQSVKRIEKWKNNPDQYELQLHILNQAIKLYEQRNS